MRKLPCGMKAILIFIMLALSSSATAITLAENGRSDYQIVVPNKRQPVTDYAARELQHFLKEISGVELPIVTENKAGSGPAILLGKCRRVKNVDTGNLKADGVLIKSIGEDVVLLGQNERGQLYSVYVLLERYLGVRFLAHDCTIMPKKRTLTLPKLDYSYSPPFMYRETLSWDSFPKEIAARQRLNGPYTKCDASTGGKIAFQPYVHSSNLLVPPEKYYKDHPEYYSLIGGKRTTGVVHAQLCLTNPDVLRIATEQVLKWIEEHPDVPIIDVSQNDGNGWCECEKCTAIVNEEGSQHGPILRFVNAIADVVAEKYPDKWIETLAYAYSTKPPAITKPRKNVIIRLCHAGCYYHGFTSCGLGSNHAANLKEWSKLTDRIFIWHYGTNFAYYIAPNQNLKGLARDILAYSSQGVNGVMVQCNYQGPGGELAELRQYLASQLLWDPGRHPMEIRQEFCRGYYGPAADDVLQFLTLMDKLSDDRSNHAFGAWDPKDTVPASFVAEGLETLGRAKSRTIDPQIVNRVEKLMLPLWYMQLTHPEIYGLDEKDAPTLLKDFGRIATANAISHINEGQAMTDWLLAMDGKYSPLPTNMVYNLFRIDKAKCENCLAWETRAIRHGGRALPAIFQHPADQGDGDATYEVPLPSAKEGERLVFHFGCAITGATEDGVRFSVLVNGQEIFKKDVTEFLPANQDDGKTGQDSILPQTGLLSQRELDLSQWAGQTINLTLRVNAIGNSANDWANWVEPRIVVEK